MESENGVAVEVEKRVIARETTKENIKNEVENDCNIGAEIQTNNEKPKPKVEAAGDNVASVETSKTSASKNSKHAKEPGGRASAASKNNKSSKDKPILKGSATISQKKKPILSQSLSFPARSAGEDPLQKSIDGSLVRTKAKATNSLAKTNTGTPGFKRSVFGRSTLVTAVTKSHTSQASLPVDQMSSPAKTAKPNKEDDDSHSTTSSTTPRQRNSGSGFSSRLEERAEKRKEFFSKLEEKILAKEAEKTNQQAKSKENQEAEIKLLRKSMAFKATPMPSFYKEPPPKVELKKIPTTRAKSPKLGRHKGSAMNNNAGEDKCCSSPRGKQQNNDSTKEKGHKDVNPKKSIRKVQAKLRSQENATIASKEECQDPHVNKSECKIDMERHSETDHPPNSACLLNATTPELVSYEVTVGV
ncbi:hypothetical protein RJT34_19508 [Clitoria ternatea]|uniref:TPX2 C-terminal domain-containing protein n=1 Tax=Clitoria ternatea TaxID=43366 RepID=A0AAN9IR56_CLITE